MLLEIDLGVADFARMNAEFDRNYINNSKTVAHASKVVNYPSWQTPVGTPAPFDFTFTLDQLYLFTGLGAIVWEITYSNMTAAGHSIDRDFGTLNSKLGSAFGSGCTSTGMVSPFAHKVTTWNMGAPLGNYGFSLQVSTAFAPAMSPVVMHIDATQQNLTAPGLCAPLLALPLVSIPIGISDGSGTIPDTYLQFPYLQPLEFGSIVTQELSLDAGQPGIPVSLSNGVVVSFLAGGAGIHQSAYLWATLPATIGTGNYVFIGGSPVAQFK